MSCATRCRMQASNLLFLSGFANEPDTRLHGPGRAFGTDESSDVRWTGS